MHRKLALLIFALLPLFASAQSMSIQACKWSIDQAGHLSCMIPPVIGIQGPPGPAGPQGLPGTSGTPGAVGPMGPQGQAGSDGKEGAPGINGRDGKDGIDGANGKDGAPGKDGRDGVDGKDGAQGPIGPAGPPWQSPSDPNFFGAVIKVAPMPTNPAVSCTYTDGSLGACIGIDPVRGLYCVRSDGRSCL